MCHRPYTREEIRLVENSLYVVYSNFENRAIYFDQSDHLILREIDTMNFIESNVE